MSLKLLKSKMRWPLIDMQSFGYSDTAPRPLTIEDSNTNRAFELWNSGLSSEQRDGVREKISASVPEEFKLTACFNYIEDHLEEFVRLAFSMAD